MTTDGLQAQEGLFPPSAYYFDHVLHDKPGILTDASEWHNNELVSVLSQTISF